MYFLKNNKLIDKKILQHQIELWTVCDFVVMSFIKIVQPKVSCQDKNMFSTKLINVLIAINMKSKQYKVYNL